MTEGLSVVFERRAIEEIGEIAEWWNEHRPTAPDLFLAELERMLSAIALMPELGARARGERVQGVRRVLLKRTSYHVFYRVSGSALQVLAVWHASRGSGPGL